MSDAMTESGIILLINGVIFGFIVGYLQILYYGYQNTLLNEPLTLNVFHGQITNTWKDQSLENPFI